MYRSMENGNYYHWAEFDADITNWDIWEFNNDSSWILPLAEEKIHSCPIEGEPFFYMDFHPVGTVFCPRCGRKLNYDEFLGSH